MTIPVPLDATAPHPLDGYLLRSRELQSREPTQPCGCYDPEAWFTLWRILGWEEQDYRHGILDALFLLAPVGAMERLHSPTGATPRTRALWWLATGGYLLDGVLPTRDAIHELVVPLPRAPWPNRTMEPTLDRVDQLIGAMR